MCGLPVSPSRGIRSEGTLISRTPETRDSLELPPPLWATEAHCLQCSTIRHCPPLSACPWPCQGAREGGQGQPGEQVSEARPREPDPLPPRPTGRGGTQTWPLQALLTPGTFDLYQDSRGSMGVGEPSAVMSCSPYNSNSDGGLLLPSQTFRNKEAEGQ